MRRGRWTSILSSPYPDASEVSQLSSKLFEVVASYEIFGTTFRLEGNNFQSALLALIERRPLQRKSRVDETPREERQ